MTEFNPFLDLASKTTDDLMSNLNKLNSRLSYYASTNNNIANQLRIWRDLISEEINNRISLKIQEKTNETSTKDGKNPNIIFETD